MGRKQGRLDMGRKGMGRWRRKNGARMSRVVGWRRVRNGDGGLIAAGCYVDSGRSTRGGNGSIEVVLLLDGGDGSGRRARR